MSIGQRISRLRKDNGFSQEYVAEKLNVSRQAVSKWETNNSAPDTYNLIALAELFHVSVEYIAIGKHEEQETILVKETNHCKTSTQKIIGFVLLGIGFLSLILGILLSELLILLSAYLLAGAILCIAVHKRFWFVAMWTFLVLTFLIISVLTTQNLFSIFNPKYYQGGFTIGMIISYTFWIWFITASVITIVALVKKHNTR